MKKPKFSKSKKKHINKTKHHNKINPAAEYITKNKAIRKLQISSTDFKRLCILKGIYPQIPNNRKFNKRKTFYYKRDISTIKREPVLEKFRELKTYLKKRIVLEKKRDPSKLSALQTRKPHLTYGHLVREKYPTFRDAVRDLSDALSLLCLYRTLPPSAVSGFDAAKAADVAQHYADFAHIVSALGLVRKVFVSLKGFYVEAVIEGESVVWIVPHRFCGEVPQNVDFLCLSTFVDFYAAMLRFVNFQIYFDASAKHPPKPNLLSASFPGAVRRSKSNREHKSQIFTDLTFFLAKETPTEVLSMAIISSGGSVVWETDLEPGSVSQWMARVTHKICDRPPAHGAAEQQSNEKPNEGKGRAEAFETVQPQWVFDSVNFAVLLPVDRYALGAACPDHLSPFVEGVTKEQLFAGNDCKELKQ